MKERHYLVYQITNLINQKIYIGIHSTKNINDGYMGSGSNIKRAIKEFGANNFKKEILFDFDNPEDMIQQERLLVDRKFIARKDVYNISIGGAFLTLDSITVKDNDGNCFNVHRTDKRWLSGEVKSASIGRNKNKVVCKDAYGNTFLIDKTDPKYISGEFVPVTTGTIAVRDKYNNMFRVPFDDLRIVSGELVGIWKDKKHSEETKKIISEKLKIQQAGEKNSQFGTCWIHHLQLKISKKIKNTELDSFLIEGWIKGRKMKFLNIPIG